jgi:hypothetical protein
MTKTDVTPADLPETARGGLWQTAVVLVLVLAAAGTGYTLRKSALQDGSPAPVAAPAGAPAAPGAPVPAVAAGKATPLGDLSEFRTVTQDTLGKLNAGDQSGATSRVDDLETGWDNAQARLKPKDEAAWTTIDGKIDTVLRRLRASSPDPRAEKPALTDLLAALG